MRIQPSKRIGIIGLIAAVVMAGTISPARATLTANVAPLATASASAPLIESPVSKLNDQNAASTHEVTTSGNGSWQVLSWGATPQYLSRIIVDMRQGYVTAGFDVQIAAAANPDGSVVGDWTTLHSYTGQPPNGASPSQYGFALSPNQVAYGIRVVATDTSNPGTSGFMRIPEIWAFNAGYNDLALTATSVAGTGWVNTAGLQDETGQNQSYGPKGNAVTWTWATAQHLGGFLLIGDPAASDYPTDYTVDAWNGSSWVNVETVTGNTQFTDYYAFNAPVVTDRFRLTITGDTYTGDSLARLGGMFIFEAVPEPSTVMLLGVGGLLLWRKRRS